MAPRFLSDANIGFGNKYPLATGHMRFYISSYFREHIYKISLYFKNKKIKMRDYHHNRFKTKELLGKRSVKKGEVIMTSTPFVYIIDRQFRGQYCDNCIVSSKNKNLKPCKKCGFIFYCSESCEVAGAEIHQHECKLLMNLDPSFSINFARLLARLIFRLQNGGDKIAEFYGENKSRRFKDLMNHYRDIKEDKERMNDVRSIYEILKKFFDPKNLPNESDFIGLYGRVLVNRFCLMDGYMCPIGSVVYLAASIFDHSCIPNASVTFKGNKIEIRSLVDWATLDLTKVFISYIDVMRTTNQRRAELKKNWYFLCDCLLCTADSRRVVENSIQCRNPDCRTIIEVPEKPESQFKHHQMPPPQCQKCQEPVNEEYLLAYQSAVSFTKHRLKGLKEDNPVMESCWEILEKQGNILPPLNVWRIRALDFAFNAAYCNGIYRLAIIYGKENNDAMRFYYGSEHPTFGLYLMKLGKSLLYLKEYREGLSVVEESEKILTVALGEIHPLLSEEITRLKLIANEDVDILMERRIADRDRLEHEKFCKHCGKRKAAAEKNKLENLKEEINKKSKGKSEDVYLAIKALKQLTETLINEETSTLRKSVLINDNKELLSSLNPGGILPDSMRNNETLAFLSKLNGDTFVSKLDKRSLLKNGELIPSIHKENEKATRKYETNRKKVSFNIPEKSENSNETENGDYTNSEKESLSVMEYDAIIYNENEFGKDGGNSSAYFPEYDKKWDKGQSNNLQKAKERTVFHNENISRKHNTETSNSELSPSIKINDKISGGTLACETSLTVGLAANLKNCDDLKLRLAAEISSFQPVIPPTLSRLYRYRDNLGIKPKSEAIRSGRYHECEKANLTTNETKDECKYRTTEVIESFAKPQLIENVPKKTSETKIVTTDNLKTTADLGSATRTAVVSNSIIETPNLVTKLPTDSVASFKHEPHAQNISETQDKPGSYSQTSLPKISKIYSKEVEEKWGLDYVPDKPVNNNITNNYKLPESSRIWNKYLADIELSWAMYIADIEFRDDESDSDEN